MRFRTTLTALTVGAALAAGAPAAFAQTANPAQQGYSVPGGAVQTDLDSGNGNAPGNETQTAAAPTPQASVQAADDSSLPFTGLDVAMIVGAGGVLLLLGFGMRRLSRPSQAV